MCPNYLDMINIKVNKATKDLDLFMRKDPPVLTMDEMRTSSTLIDKYGLLRGGWVGGGESQTLCKNLEVIYNHFIS